MNDIKPIPELRLAPMEGVSDFAFRLWISLFSELAAASTPFLRITPSYPARLPSYFAPELDTLEGYLSYKLYPQLMVANSEDFIRVAGQFKSEFVEINCGCPASVVVGNGAGSSLLKNPNNFREFLSRCIDKLGAEKFAVKMRLGLEEDQEFDELLEALTPLEMAQLSLHPRTKKTRYASYARWQKVNLAAETLAYPVIGSGDILGFKSLNERLEFTRKSPSVLIGRGAIRNPWIFFAITKQKEEILIEARLLSEILLVYLALNELFKNDFESLIKLVKSSIFLTPLREDYLAWKALRERIYLEYFQNKDWGMVVEGFHPKLLGRVKLIWNYLRSSLDTSYFANRLLRAKSLLEFFKLLEAEHVYELTPVRHRQDRDWIYTSDKKDPGDYNSKIF